MKKKILVICAHPDDETFGMGGTILKHTSKGNIVDVLTLTDGSSSQYENFSEMIIKKEDEAKKAMNILGVKNIEFNQLPDMRLDTVSHVKINSVIENKIKKFMPNIVYTHFWGDVNLDHKRVFESTIVATRPTQNQSIEKTYAYEIPSSTEWQAPINGMQFLPSSFVDISEYLDKKIQAINCYESEIREYPHPRSPKAVSIYNQRAGVSIGKSAAERFFLLREII